MTREIKFRGKRLGNGEWVVGDLLRHYENQRRFIACDQLAYTYTECGIDRLVSERYHEVDHETVGQYTGLKDDNNNEIYEGDIVQIAFQWGKPSRHVVEYQAEQDYPAFDLYPSLGGESNGLSHAKATCAIVVIGNIHEHPELLK